MPEIGVNNSSLANPAFSNEAKSPDKNVIDIYNKLEDLKVGSNLNSAVANKLPDTSAEHTSSISRKKDGTDSPQEHLDNIVQGILDKDLVEGQVGNMGLTVKDQQYVLNAISAVKFGRISPENGSVAQGEDNLSGPNELEKVKTGNSLSNKRDFWRQHSYLDSEIKTEASEHVTSPQKIIDYIQNNSFKQAQELELLRKHPDFRSKFKGFLAGDYDFKVGDSGEISKNKLAIFGRKALSTIFNKRVVTASAIAVGMAVLTGGIGATAAGGVIGSAVGRAAGEMATTKKELMAKQKIIEAKAKVWNRLEILSNEYRNSSEAEKATLLKQIVDLYHEKGEDDALDSLAQAQVGFETQQKRLDKTKKIFQMTGEVAGLAGGLGLQHFAGKFDAIDLDFFNKVPHQSIFHSVVSHSGGNYAQLTQADQISPKLMEYYGKLGIDMHQSETLLRGISQSNVLVHALVERGLPVLVGAYAGELFGRKKEYFKKDDVANHRYEAITGTQPENGQKVVADTSPKVTKSVVDLSAKPKNDTVKEPVKNAESLAPIRTENEKKPKNEGEMKKFWENKMLENNHSKLPEENKSWLEKKDGNPSGDMVMVEGVDFKLDPPRVAVKRENDSFITYEFIAINDFLKNFVRGEKVKSNVEVASEVKSNEKEKQAALNEESLKLREDLLDKELELDIFSRKDDRRGIVPSLSTIKHNNKSYGVDLISDDYKTISDHLEERLKEAGTKSIKEKVTLAGTKIKSNGRGSKIVLVVKLIK